MYDDLVKALHESAEFLECSTPGIKNSFAKMCHNAADAIEELSRNEQLRYMPLPSWVPVTEYLPAEFQPVWAACKADGYDNWVIETMYDPYLKCPWGPYPLLEMGKAVVYAWLDRSAPNPPEEYNV